MGGNRPFAVKPSHHLLFIKLWAATLGIPEMKKACQKNLKWPSSKPLALKNEFFDGLNCNKPKICMEKIAGE